MITSLLTIAMCSSLHGAPNDPSVARGEEGAGHGRAGSPGNHHHPEAHYDEMKGAYNKGEQNSSNQQQAPVIIEQPNPTPTPPPQTNPNLPEQFQPN